ncbi:hypothetical protein BDV40DRAFT_306869 [Aspergillus tamarii]|uniref:Uncharacterized protein n=1 Tax=Aspergillus tamarii TaxID=41984 RepID=A0A5N6UAG4_ASPTM|nr:hypothetical protein BDV40DRAFT_306869 [Aspergillus tamarii]
MVNTRSGNRAKGKQPVSQAKVSKAKSDTPFKRTKLEQQQTTLKEALDQNNAQSKDLKDMLARSDIADDEKKRLQEEYNNIINARSTLQDNLNDLGHELAGLDREDQEMNDVEHPEASDIHESQSPTEQMMPPLYGGESSFSQTRPDNPIEMASDSETPGEPENYHDIDNPVTDDTLPDDEGSPSDLLHNGITLLQHKYRGKIIQLNSYGPKNSAVLIWSSSTVDREVKEMKWLKGPHHQKALQRDDKGDFVYKHKIKEIGAVAWKPRRNILDMDSLLNSVEEINPDKKRITENYTFPFSTVLVFWKDGPDMPSPVWLGRTEYKDLSGKDKQRADTKIYKIARRQADRYRNWIGDERIGLDRTPTPFPETPEPGGIGPFRQGQDPTSRSQVGQSLVSRSGQSQNGQSQNNQNQNGQSQNDQGQNDQGQNNQNQNGQSQNDQAQSGHTQGSAEENVKPIKLSGFFEKWCKRHKLDPKTTTTTLDDVMFARWEGAKDAYLSTLESAKRPYEDDVI